MRIKKIAVLAAAVICALSFIACKSEMDKYGPYISELRSNVYEGASENFKVGAITGTREDPYVLDGHNSGSRDFTVITIEPAEYIANFEYGYKAVINGNEYTGKFLPHPFGKTFSADINVRCNTDTITCVVITSGQNEEFILKSVMTEDMITPEKALEIAAARLKKQVDDLTAGGVLGAEIYIRLMSNPIDNSGGYYWYVAFLGPAQEIYAVLIDPRTMDIVAVRD